MRFRKIYRETITTAIIIVCFFVLLGGILAGAIINENNRIDSGVIVDKHMDSGGSALNSDIHGSHYRNYPPSYRFTIEGRKNGEIVQYTFEVSEEEYNAYKIGDQYNR